MGQGAQQRGAACGQKRSRNGSAASHAAWGRQSSVWMVLAEVAQRRLIEEGGAAAPLHHGVGDGRGRYIGRMRARAALLRGHCDLEAPSRRGGLHQSIICGGEAGDT